jgi:hypothetical protein
MLAGGPLDFRPEAAGEGVCVGRRGGLQSGVAGFEVEVEVAGEVVLVVPGLGADRRGSVASRTAGSPSSMPRSTRRYASSGVLPSKAQVAALPASRPSSAALASSGSSGPVPSSSPRTPSGPPPGSTWQPANCPVASRGSPSRAPKTTRRPGTRDGPDAVTLTVTALVGLDRPAGQLTC